ncbi:hypothetical protein D0B03_07465 [Campylobacter upsaliensis]|uniref:Uncharacterized protein n=1 Tax=Campylobacter upsaliensis TaxID=28080 RepID=A0A5L8ZAA7_CAMUP|nr:hypothetical protein [Campylobacter upsaliensis]
MQNEENVKPKKNSPAYQRLVQQDVIDTIENTEFFQKDIYDKLEQYDFLTKQSDKEIEDNLKRQKELEEQLKNFKEPESQEKQENINDDTIQKEDPLRAKKLIEDELKTLKNKEKDLRNRVEEAKAEVTEALSNAIKAKDIGELLRALVKAFNAYIAQRNLNGKLKDELAEKKLRQQELNNIKKFHQIAKDIGSLSNNEENKNFLREMCLKVVNARNDAKNHKRSLENAKEYYKKFENLLSGYEMKNEKAQKNAKESIEKLFKEVKEKCSEYRGIYKNQFRKIDTFLNPEKIQKQELAKQRLNKVKKANAFKNQAQMAI